MTLLKFKKPLNLRKNELVSPICLPNTHEETLEYKEGQVMLTTDWGNVQEDDPPTPRTPQKVEVAYESFEKCKQLSYFTPYICWGCRGKGRMPSEKMNS